MGSGRFHKELLILLLLAAFGIRLCALSTQPLWWDEGYSLYASSMPVGTMIVETAEDIHPPLYYALLHCWQAFAGASPVSVRLFSAFVGVLTVLLVFVVVARMGGPRLAWLAAILAAVNPFLVYYSQEVRMYALTALLALLSTYLMLLWLDRRVVRTGGSGGGLAFAYLAITALALYTHYYAVFVVLAQTIFVLTGYRTREVRVRWLIGQGVLAILYLPWVIFTLTKLTAYVGGKVAIEQSQPLGPLDFLVRHLAALAMGHLPAEWSGLNWIALPFLALAVLGAVKGGQLVTRKADWLFWPILVLTALIGTFVVNMVYPFHPRGFERLVLFAAPAYCILVAAGLLILWRRLRVAGVLILAALLAASGIALWTLYTTPRYVDDDYRPLISHVNQSAWPEDAVLCLFPWQIGYFDSYYDGMAPHLLQSFKVDWPARLTDASVLPTYIDSLMARYRRVWFPAHQTEGRILENELAAYLAANNHTVVSEWANPHTRLYLFTTPTGMAASNEAFNFDNRLHLSSHALTQTAVPADGGVVDVELDWQRVADLTEPYYVGLRLVDDMDYTWALRSAEPVGGLRPFSEWSAGETVRDRHGLLLTADTPPGEYHVKAGVYRRSDGLGLGVLNAAGLPVGVEADLGAVQVAWPARAPAPERVPIASRRALDFASADGEIVRLLGYSLARTDYTPGETLDLALFWQPLTTLTTDAQVRLQLSDAAGQPVVSQTSPTVFGRYPTTQWTAGYPVRDPQRVVIPPETPAGEYTIQVGLAATGTGQPFAAAPSGYAVVDLQRITVGAGRSHDFAPPQVPNTLQATWGDHIQLLGYGPLPGSYAPGDTVSLALYWKALASMETSYTVFVHLLDEDGQIRGQADAVPGAGTLPTTGWVPDEYLQDGYTFAIQENAPPGTYQVEIGVYDSATGNRLPVRLDGESASSDHVVIPVDIHVAGR